MNFNIDYFIDNAESNAGDDNFISKFEQMSDLEENDDNIASVSDIDKDKIDHVGGKSEPSARECPKVEAESDSGDLPIKASNSVPQKEEVEKASELLQLPDERAMRSDTVNESDGSDIMEQDVSIVP